MEVLTISLAVALLLILVYVNRKRITALYRFSTIKRRIGKAYTLSKLINENNGNIDIHTMPRDPFVMELGYIIYIMTTIISIHKMGLYEKFDKLLVDEYVSPNFEPTIITLAIALYCNEYSNGRNPAPLIDGRPYACDLLHRAICAMFQTGSLHDGNGDMTDEGYYLFRISETVIAFALEGRLLTDDEEYQMNKSILSALESGELIATRKPRVNTRFGG